MSVNLKTTGDDPANPVLEEEYFCHGMTKREAFAMAAMQGMLASESYETGYCNTYLNAEGMETSIASRRPDYTKPEIPNTLIRTASQNRCRAAVREADDLIAALNVPQP